MPHYETLKVEDRGAIRLVTIDRPDALNALNAQVVDELTTLLEATAKADVRGLLLTGGGRAFVAGADIAAMAQMSPDAALRFAGRGHAVGEMLQALPIPTCAAVNGFALGGGCELALACDFIYASTKAKFGQPEIKLGVIPGFGGTQRLLRRVGNAVARELVYTGKMVDAQEALRIGLVNAVFEPGDLMAKTRETATTIAGMAPIAMAEAKRVLLQGEDAPLGEAIAGEARAFGRCFATKDQKEGMRAFLEKRAANFTGE